MRKLDFIVKAFSYEDDAPHYITKYNNIFHSNGTFGTACHFNTEEEAEKAINKIKEASHDNLIWLEFEEDISWYRHIVDSSSKIDKLKQDKLFDLVKRMLAYFDDMTLISDDDIMIYRLK